MVEGDAQEISEVDLLEALDIAHQEIKRICEAQKELQKLAGKEKRVVTPPVSLDELKSAVAEMALEKIKTVITIPDKLMRQQALDEILKEVIEKMNTAENDITRDLSSVFNDY